MNNEYVNYYFKVVEQLLKKYNQIPTAYKDLKISNIVGKNYKVNGNWKYHRHHIEEIFLSGAFLQSDKEHYAQGLSLVVSIEEHSFLHYLIVNAGLTEPNDGMLMSISLTQWDTWAKEFCKIYNIPYDPCWTKKLTHYGKMTF
ncbi:hypothetical protein [Mycoplasmopsis iners]|uniref:hypothetical protein n=1 Tax=Mycoplasmopsis iners TaxID=76630 RepID=UPI0006899A50|nr:hypothetical protein [Mycoplasmopsis iners]